MRISIKMRKEIIQTVEIPDGVEIKIEDPIVTVKGSEGELSKKFNFHNIEVKQKAGELTIGNEKATKNEKKMINTNAAHIRNMIKGVTQKFEYKLKICSSHFPMTVKIEGDDIIVKNFLGEKIERRTKIPKGAEVNLDKEFITVTSTNKEIAGQAAANFEAATRIRGRDIRVFQDGIYIINKAGKEI